MEYVGHDVPVVPGLLGRRWATDATGSVFFLVPVGHSLQAPTAAKSTSRIYTRFEVMLV